MRAPRIGIRLVAVLAVAGPAACAPGFGAGGLGGGLRLGINPGLGMDLSPSSCLLLGTSMAPDLALQAGPAAQAGARRQQVARTQARYSFGSGDLPRRMQSRKRLAGGGC